MSVTLRQNIRLILRGILLTSIVAALGAVVVGCDDVSVTPTPTVEATVAAGGMVVPTVTNELMTTPPIEVVIYLPGQVVQTNAPLSLYADATATAMLMKSYAAATEFTVIEPSGEYDSYPVVSSEQQWYRVRAADGLVGWAIAEQLAPLP